MTEKIVLIGVVEGPSLREILGGKSIFEIDGTRLNRPPVRQVVECLPVSYQTEPPKKWKKARRFLVIINWYGERHEMWTHVKAKFNGCERLVKQQALCNAIRTLAKRVGYSPYYVYQYVTTPNTDRREVHEQ